MIKYTDQVYGMSLREWLDQHELTLTIMRTLSGVDWSIHGLVTKHSDMFGNLTFPVQGTSNADDLDRWLEEVASYVSGRKLFKKRAWYQTRILIDNTKLKVRA